METEEKIVNTVDCIKVYPAFIIFNFILAYEKVIGFNRFIADTILIASLLLTSLSVVGWSIKSLRLYDGPIKSLFLFIYGALTGLFLKLTLSICSINFFISISSFPISIVDPAWKLLYILASCTMFQGILQGVKIRELLKIAISTSCLVAFMIPVVSPSSIETLVSMAITALISSIIFYKVKSLIPPTFLLFIVSFKGIIV
ncbi:MAG TPA: hypothetical protein ENG22_03985 [Candidatus Bathyarchaeota archaeon]|nr:hypothetical protein [Candidatus Bathyarchaeota archaeon]